MKVIPSPYLARNWTSHRLSTIGGITPVQRRVIGVMAILAKLGLLLAIYTVLQ
jgi:hypothetical protein